MKKRILCFVMVIMLAVSSFASAAGSDFMAVMVNELLEYNSEERQSLITLTRSILGLDSGIDMIRPYITDWNESKTDEYSVYIGKLLKFYSKEEMNEYVNAFSLVDEDIRYGFFTGIIERKAVTVTYKESQAAKTVADYMFSENREGFTRLCEDEGITMGVFCNMLKFYKDANGGVSPYNQGTDGKLKYNTLTRAYREMIEVKGYGSAEEVLEKINSHPTLVSAIKTIGKVTGLYNGKLESTGGGGGGDTGSETEKEDKPTENAKPASKEVTPTLSSSIKAWEISGVGETPIKFVLDAGNEKAVLFLVENGVKTPVKRTFNYDGKITAFLSQNGTYEAIIYENPFADAKGTWGEKFIVELNARGIINGKGDGIFEPDSPITREEFVTLIVQLFAMTSDKKDTPFVDVLKSHWYEKFVSVAYNNGIVNGTSMTRFGAGQKITRQDISKIILNVILKENLAPESQNPTYEKFNDAASIADYAKSAVSTLSELKIVNGDDLGNFNPTGYATRQEAATMIYGLLKLYVGQ